MSLDTVIAVSFDEDRSAYEAFTNLRGARRAAAGLCQERRDRRAR